MAPKRAGDELWELRELVRNPLRIPNQSPLRAQYRQVGVSDVAYVGLDGGREVVAGFLKRLGATHIQDRLRPVRAESIDVCHCTGAQQSEASPEVSVAAGIPYRREGFPRLPWRVDLRLEMERYLASHEDELVDLQAQLRGQSVEQWRERLWASAADKALDGRHIDGAADEALDGRHIDGRHINGQYIDGRHTDGAADKALDGRHIDGRHIDI